MLFLSFFIQSVLLLVSFLFTLYNLSLVIYYPQAMFINCSLLFNQYQSPPPSTVYVSGNSICYPSEHHAEEILHMVLKALLISYSNNKNLFFPLLLLTLQR